VKRAFVIVLDACGVGELPDAETYGDRGTNTLAHVAREAGGLRLPTLARLGLGSIVPLEGVPPSPQPVVFGKLHPLGPGKDSTTGHWELMGVVAPRPMPTYPEGFPPEVVELVKAASGRGVICNRTRNGIQAIEEFASSHLEGGELIVYTSQDSVLQIAAHVELVPLEELYTICGRVRGSLPPQHAVGRVIARPFTGVSGRFTRTYGRRDFSIRPPSRSYLQEIHDSGLEVHVVGKAGELFCGLGVDVQHPGPTNSIAIGETTELMRTLRSGMVFANLIETDQVYGHRHDIPGFYGALREIDRAVARWLELLGSEDLLVLTADHGCDPTAAHTDHTREFAPLLARFGGQRPRRHDGPLADVGASALWWLTTHSFTELPGEPFVREADARAA